MTILQKDNKILREKAKPVENIESAEIKNLISRMAEAMFKEPDGIGIAAPQIGESIKIFLVAKDALTLEIHASDEKNSERKKEYLVFINPELKKFSKEKNKDVEGCLSVRGFYGEVDRAQKLTIIYFDEYGQKHTRGASGLFARVIQHEMDHLNGMLFIDKAKNITKISNE